MMEKAKKKNRIGIIVLIGAVMALATAVICTSCSTVEDTRMNQMNRMLRDMGEETGDNDKVITIW